MNKHLLNLLLGLGLFKGLSIVEDGSGGQSMGDPDQEQPDQEQPDQEQPDEATIEDGIRKDEARLTVIQEDYNNMADTLNDEYESILKTNPTSLFSEDELELLASDSDISAKNKLLRDRFETYRDEKLSEKKQEIEKFEDELKNRKGQFDILSQSNKFSKENPDVDMEEFADFIQGDLTPNQKKQMRDNSESKYDFLKLAYEEYKKQNPSKAEDDELPPDLSGINGATGDANFSSESKMEAYRKQVGMSE